MNPGGNNRTRRLEREIEDLEVVAKIVGQTIPLWRELCRRDQEQTGPDGYSTTTGGSSDSTISTRNVSSTTETAALRLSERGVEPDPLHASCVRVEGMIPQLRHDSAVILSLVANALKLGETNRGRQSSITTCANPYCLREIPGTERDRPRAGRCDVAGHQCYRNWLRYGEDRRPNGGEAA